MNMNEKQSALRPVKDCKAVGGQRGKAIAKRVMEYKMLLGEDSDPGIEDLKFVEIIGDCRCAECRTRLLIAVFVHVQEPKTRRMKVRNCCTSGPYVDYPRDQQERVISEMLATLSCDCLEDDEFDSDCPEDDEFDN